MKKKGFTLVETIVVITIFSIIAVGIASSFTAGMKIWGRARNVDFTQSEALLNLERMAGQLRQCVNISSIGFGGTNEEIFFPAVYGNLAGKIIYKFDAPSKTILLRFQTLENILAQEEEDAEEEVEYIERKIASAESFSLSYLYFDEEEVSYEWVDEWKKEEDEDDEEEEEEEEDDKGIFSAVKLEVGVGQDKFVKTVFIPIAAVAVDEESIEVTDEGPGTATEDMEAESEETSSEE
ncbi:MAG: type II secretion system protein [Candidatus Omnitrophota bacterium]|nr:MAG: type II secretion system protein [Candidatus Omnitrophota bacterium]